MEELPPDRSDADLPDLTYRRLVHRQRQGQEQLLDSIPHRVQVKLVLFVWASIDLQP